MEPRLATIITLVSLLSILCLPAHAQTSFRPKALVVPVSKDAATLQYVTQIKQKTPLQTEKLVVDLGGRYLWVDCDNYESSSYRPVRCRSAQCSLANADSCSQCFAPPRPGCNNDTCGVFPGNPFISTSTSGDLLQDIVVLDSTDGKNPGRSVSIPRYLFSCAPNSLLEGLASGARGIAALGRTRVALPTQLAAAFSFDRKFAICLTSSPSSKGVIFFGDGPYVLLPRMDVSQNLIYTPLLINPVSTAGVHSKGEPSYEYFIGVKSIVINEKQVPLNSTLLSFDSQGVGGTKISTVDAYTTLETSIYKAVTTAFIREAAARNISRVAAVKPFEVCFSAANVGSTRVGPAVPWIDLVLQSSSTIWRIFGSNSMVQVNKNVLCLGFIDGGVNPRTSIVIGGYQLEDNLLQFDLATSRLGFSSSLLFGQTTCANFNFTSSV